MRQNELIVKDYKIANFATTMMVLDRKFGVVNVKLTHDKITTKCCNSEKSSSDIWDEILDFFKNKLDIRVKVIDEFVEGKYNVKKVVLEA